MRVVDALLLEPAHAGLARALVIGHIQLRRELTLPEHHVPSQPEPAHRGGKHRRQPVRHTGHRRDHRARQHGLVEQRRMRLQHTRPDAAAHRMAVQVQRTAIRVILAHRLREFRQIGHIPPPIINPHQGRIVDVTRGIPMSAVLEHAHRVPCEQEVPHHLRIFRGELREPVGDHHAPRNVAAAPSSPNRSNFAAS